MTIELNRRKSIATLLDDDGSPLAVLDIHAGFDSASLQVFTAVQFSRDQACELGALLVKWGETGRLAEQTANEV